MIDIEFDSCRQIHTGDGGYNGCIEAYDNDSYLYFYRREEEVCFAPFYLNYCFVSKTGEMQSPCVNLNYGRQTYHPLLAESNIDEYDPRVIQWGGRNEYVLFSVFNNRLRSRFITIKDDWVYFTKHSTLSGYNFQMQEYEKNWMPFKYNDDLYMIYSIKPHIVVQFHRAGICEKLYETTTPFEWRWGTPSGGTQAVKINDNEYLTFFHSFTTPDRSSNRVPREYFAGAYTFESRPPFRVLRITPEPLFWDGLYQTVSQSPHLVVFPAGLVNENGLLSMTYGENDGSTYLAKFPVDRILKTMKFV